MTLIEVLVVLVLAGVILVIAIPNLIRARVRAEMLGEVGMLRQALAIARVNAIRAGSPVGMAMESGAVVAWVDDNGDEDHDGGERQVGRWTFRPTFTVTEDPANRLYRLGGTTAGVLYLPTGSALVEQGSATAIGDGAVIVQDFKGNQIRLLIQAGTGTVQQAMKVPGTEEWDAGSMRHWSY
jgi:type II secretory pathway pseudopilin PulG